MVRAKFVVLYFSGEIPETEVRSLLRSYVVLHNPDVESLTDALQQASFQSRKITVIRISNGTFYVAPGEYPVKSAEKGYEFLVSKEDGLRKVAEEILGVKKKWTFDTALNIVQAVLWVVALLLGYFGYKNDALKEASSYMMVLFFLSWAVEGLRRGYKKRERVRASAPRHSSE